MTRAIEEWRPIPGYEGFYSVSSLGRVRSEARSVDGRRLRRMIRRQATDHQGYQFLSLSRDGVNRYPKVHALVTAAFIGPRPDGYDVHHLGKKRDNWAINLTYIPSHEHERVTMRLGQKAHGKRHGRQTKPERTARGSRHGNSIEESVALQVQEGLAAGRLGRDLADEFHVCQTTISRLRRGTHWATVRPK